MRKPASAVVVDSAILVAAARGRSAGAFLSASKRSNLVTTDRAVHEARRRILIGMERPDLIATLERLAQEIVIIPLAVLQSKIGEAETALEYAVPSRNGSRKDAHVLALAWHVGADIWSADRDFAGTGVASWSTPNLMNAYAEYEPQGK